jgi:hypothetical protein
MQLSVKMFKEGVDDQAHGLTDWQIVVSNQQLVCRANTLYTMLGFLSYSLPNYERLPDKPNQCTSPHADNH